MSSASENEDLRAALRCTSEATARVVRELDPTRSDIIGRLQDISNTGLCLLLSTPLEPEEYITIKLENPIQRARVQTRGQVRRVEPLPEGGYRIGIALLRRLTPREVLDQRLFQSMSE